MNLTTVSVNRIPGYLFAELFLPVNLWLPLQGAYGSWKITEFKIQIFHARKVVESGLCDGKS